MLIPFKWPVMPHLQGARVIYCCLKRKWCWKGNSIFTRNRDFQRVRWTFYFSIIFNWIASEHYVTLQLKNHNSSNLYKLNFLSAVCQTIARWANHLLASFSSLGSRNFLIDLDTDEVKGRKCKTKTCTCYCYRCSNDCCKRCNGNTTSCYR